MTTSPRPLFTPVPDAPLAPRPAPVGRHGLLIGDLERDATCQQLAQHFAAGRLTADELDQRVDASMRARTNIDLHLLTADLPGGAGPGLAMVAPPVSGAAVNPLRTLAEGLAFCLTLAAIGCTALLLLGLLAGGGSYAFVAWLAAFGASVSVAGAFHFARRWRSTSPGTQPLG
ncbi:DUF1707 SHOCT-like domain-containing protein [Aestuariimicrobium ganziense]|uniref:DUF1707 SHOCT-like domain-containing protein n=1 Tax=Aestuariimicrobium ganziense TaxID=2773677 RepID=UPI001941F69E|nr:DUF1707 domain-containing protein [Aestuariimicrobium ganziense]